MSGKQIQTRNRRRSKRKTHDGNTHTRNSDELTENKVKDRAIYIYIYRHTLTHKRWWNKETQVKHMGGAQSNQVVEKKKTGSKTALEDKNRQGRRKYSNAVKYIMLWQAWYIWQNLGWALSSVTRYETWEWCVHRLQTCCLFFSLPDPEKFPFNYLKASSVQGF